MLNVRVLNSTQVFNGCMFACYDKPEDAENLIKLARDDNCALRDGNLTTGEVKVRYADDFLGVMV